MLLLFILFLHSARRISSGSQHHEVGGLSVAQDAKQAFLLPRTLQVLAEGWCPERCVSKQARDPRGAEVRLVSAAGADEWESVEQVHDLEDPMNVRPTLNDGEFDRAFLREGLPFDHQVKTGGVNE